MHIFTLSRKQLWSLESHVNTRGLNFQRSSEGPGSKSCCPSFLSSLSFYRVRRRDHWGGINTINVKKLSCFFYFFLGRIKDMLSAAQTNSFSYQVASASHETSCRRREESNPRPPASTLAYIYIYIYIYIDSKQESCGFSFFFLACLLSL